MYPTDSRSTSSRALLAALGRLVTLWMTAGRYQIDKIDFPFFLPLEGVRVTYKHTLTSLVGPDDTTCCGQHTSSFTASPLLCRFRFDFILKFALGIHRKHCSVYKPVQTRVLLSLLCHAQYPYRTVYISLHEYSPSSLQLAATMDSGGSARSMSIVRARNLARGHI